MIMPSPSHHQAYQVAKHLTDLSTISALEATSLYRITSLTKVISVLNNRYGFAISKEWRNDHTGKRYARYFSN